LAEPVYAPIFPPGYDAQPYTVEIDSIAVAGTTIPLAQMDFPSTMLDTGSSISSLPPDTFAALTAAIEGSDAFKQLFGANAAGFFSSYTHHVNLSQSADELDAMLPRLTLTLPSGATFEAPATQGYLMQMSGDWYPAMTTRTPSSTTYPAIAAIFGAPILRSNVVIFDREQHRVGFAPHAACP
jgi:hypothetical protein